GPGAGCHGVGDPVCRLGGQCGLSGCAIPVAWVVLPAKTKHAWRRAWLRLVRRLRPAIPRGWQVIVLTDRGLYAPWLFWRIVRLGWHPFLRINTGGDFPPGGTRCFFAL